MKKSNKGFTLVELLAAVVILAILIGVSIPLIISLLNNSRNKMYISDAKKLVAQAEYKLKSNNSNIELPDQDDCIVFNLTYLNSSLFDNPPNGGKYQKENSFVIVKNLGNNKYDYSVMLVEKIKKGGYKGVELISNSALNAADATKHVVSFKVSDLITVKTVENNPEDENYLTPSYINSKLGNDYVGKITNKYTEPDFSDNSTLTDDDFIPNIVSVSLSSTNAKGYNLINAELQLKVVDKDSTYTNLKVYLSTTGYEMNGVEPIMYCSSSENCKSIFTTNINFGDNSLYVDGSTKYLYIIVEDEKGNKTQKKVKYIIHKNESPVIDSTKSNITKRDYDNVAMTKAFVTLAVTDDIDDYSDLRICFTENKDATTCSNYQSYTDVFIEGNTFEYQFTCNGECIRDGQTHYLKVFVKDSLNKETSLTLNPYVFSTNSKPTISRVDIISDSEPFTSDKAKNVFIRVDARDQEDSLNQLRIKVTGGVEEKIYQYNSGGYNNFFSYKVADNYPNSATTKTINVTVIDSEGLESTTTSKNYSLFVNTAPTINTFNVSSNGTACTNELICPKSDGGSKEVNIQLDVTDVIDYEYKNIQICISDKSNGSDCTYTSYSNYKDKLVTKTFNDWTYDGSNKTIYVFAKDSLGLVSSTSKTYKVYKDKSPILDEVNGVKIVNKGEVCLDQNNNICTASTPVNNKKIVANANSYNVTLGVQEAQDDFDTSGLRYCLTTEASCNPDKSYSELNKTINLYTQGTPYSENDSKVIKLFVKDTNGNISSIETDEYEIYTNKAPTVSSFQASSSQIACNNSELCPINDSNGSKTVDIRLELNDDFDYNPSNLQVCITDKNVDTDCTYTSYENYKDKIVTKAFDSWTYNGSTKSIYAFFKDSMNKKDNGKVEYKLYKDEAPIIKEGSLSIKSAFDSGDDEEIENGVYAVFNSIAYDDFTKNYDDLTPEELSNNTPYVKASYCYKIGNGSEKCPSAYQNIPYKTEMKLNKDFFNEAISNTSILEKDYFVYVKLTDGENKTRESDKLNYHISAMQDNPPIILMFNIATASTEDSKKLKIKVSVDDINDYYNICLSETNGTNPPNNCEIITTGKTCLDDSCEEELLAGNNTIYYIDYTASHVIEDGTSYQLYGYIKDSFNQKAKREDMEASEPTYINDYPHEIYNKTYNYCTRDDINTEKFKYVYEFNPTKNYTDFAYDDDGNIIYEGDTPKTVIINASDNHQITPSLCENKCYHYDIDGNEKKIFGFYDQRISYFDLFRVTECPGLEEVAEYKAYCDFKDCFRTNYGSNEYSQNVVGTRAIELDEADYFTFVVGDITYECDAYYNKYISSYNLYDEDITLTKTETIMCKQYMDDLETNPSLPRDPDLIRIAD